MKKSLLGAIVVVAGVSLALTACTGGGDDANEQEQSPLEKYLSAIWGGNLSQEEQEAQWAEQQKKVEELVAECMTEQGFEYIPNVNNGSVSYGSDVEWLPDDRAWVEKWGYGAAEYPGQDDVPQEPTEEYIDPNQEYVSSLSESEQNAFYEALYGVGPTEEEMNDPDYEYDWTTAGCYGPAQQEGMGGAQQLYESEEFAPLFDSINTFYEEMAANPGFADLDAEWVACMDEAGYPGFVQQYDAQNSIYDKLNAVWENQSYSETGPTEAEQEEIDAQIKEIGVEERKLALADLDCREKTDYREQQKKLQFEAEQEFVDQHKAELEALKAAAEQAAP